MTTQDIPEFITYHHDFRDDNPNFSLYKFGPLQWGTQKIEYLDQNGQFVTMTLKPWGYHHTTLMLLPQTESIIETCMLNLSELNVFTYKVQWQNIPKVVAHIHVTIGEENNKDSIQLNFYYRDMKIAKNRWNDIVKNSSNTESRVLKSDNKSLLVARQMDLEVLSDPDLYLLYTKYLKSIKGLHWDHNSELERWTITWLE